MGNSCPCPPSFGALRQKPPLVGHDDPPLLQHRGRGDAPAGDAGVLVPLVLDVGAAQRAHASSTRSLRIEPSSLHPAYSGCRIRLVATSPTAQRGSWPVPAKRNTEPPPLLPMGSYWVKMARPSRRRMT
ncbi:hypothetical protein ARSEF4850_005192 [Beauveria asiatica]